MKAISTTFKEATDTDPARIIARDGDGNRVIISYPLGVGTVDAHHIAANRLCEKMGWEGALTGGWVGFGGIDYAFTFSA